MNPPDPSMVKAAREYAGLTQKQCAALIHVTLRAWQCWEYGTRTMHPAFWELFCIKRAAEWPQTAEERWLAPHEE